MASGLVRVLSAGAGVLIAATAVERGWRHGGHEGNDAVNDLSADIIMRSTMSTTDNFMLEGISDSVRDGVAFDNGFLSSMTKFWHSTTGAIGGLFSNILPLGVAALGAIAGGPIGWLCLGGLAIWGGSSVLKSSGVVGTDATERFDMNG